MPKGLLPSSRPRFRLCANAQLTNNCNMANAFCQAGYPRSTLRDFVLIAELRIVDKLEFASREICVGSVRELEVVCRRRLRKPASYGEHATRGTAVQRSFRCKSKSIRYILTLLQVASIKNTILYINDLTNFQRYEKNTNRHCK